MAALLEEALRLLLPHCMMQPVSIGALNGATLIPRKDHDANVIWPAALQLPAGAALLLDEANMGPGNLVDRGVKNGERAASEAEGAIRERSERESDQSERAWSVSVGPASARVRCG